MIKQPMSNMENLHVAVPDTKKELNLKRYFATRHKTEQPRICYNIDYTLQEYKPNKFCLSIVTEEEGYYEETEEYYFEGISKINTKFMEENDGVEFTVDFITYPSHVTTYTFDRFNYEDVDKLHQFIVNNVIYK